MKKVSQEEKVFLFATYLLSCIGSLFLQTMSDPDPQFSTSLYQFIFKYKEHIMPTLTVLIILRFGLPWVLNPPQNQEGKKGE